MDTSTVSATVYMENVEARDAETLLPIIQSEVNLRSIVLFHEWRTYRCFEGIGLQHKCQPFNKFAEPETGVHTYHIESNWNRKKCNNKNAIEF